MFKRVAGWRHFRKATAALAIVAVSTVLYGALGHNGAIGVPTALVTRDDFIDVVDLRGEIRPLKSVALTAPMQSGELQIIRLVKNGTTVNAGDLVVEFDSTSLKRSYEDRKTELKQSQAEIDQAQAQVKISQEESTTRLLRARFDVDRAALDVVEGDFIARLDHERAVLALDDAKQRLVEAGKRHEADQAGTATTLAARERRRDRIKQDLARIERGLEALELRAPSAGTVSVMQNNRTANAGRQDFHEGDRVWPGATIVELPDLSAVHLTARLEESDRGRVALGQVSAVRLDAIPDRDYRAEISSISLLARIDFSSAWPPARDFDVELRISNADTKLKPGMTAAVRVAVGKLAGVLIVPVEAVSLVNGRPTVYRQVGSKFEATPVSVLKRGREQIAIASGVEAGDRVALKTAAASGSAGTR